MSDTVVDLALLTRLTSLLNETSEGRLQISLTQSGERFKEIGVDSVLFLTFLVAIEDTFGIEWSDDTPVEVFVTMESMTEFLQSHHDVREPA